MTPRIAAALAIAMSDGSVDGAHHKAWVIDQMVRALTGCPDVRQQAKDCNGVEYSFVALGESDEYRRFLAMFQAGEDGPETYSWDVGIPP